MLIDADWYWFALFDADWLWLMLLVSDWCWLMLIDIDWCWLGLIDAFGCWIHNLGMYCTFLKGCNSLNSYVKSRRNSRLLRQKCSFSKLNNFYKKVNICFIKSSSDKLDSDSDTVAKLQFLLNRDCQLCVQCSAVVPSGCQPSNSQLRRRQQVIFPS